MASKGRIAIFSIDAKLGREVKGATRYVYLAELLQQSGYEVDFITSRFQHWEKRQRDLDAFDYSAHSFKIKFIEEPSYPKNMCPQRIWAHHVMAGRVAEYFECDHAYDLIYSQIPPNDITLAIGRVAKKYNIPFVIDVNDLWPEAFRIALDVPVLSDIAFSPFYHQAKAAYDLADAIVGTSDEYASRGFKDRAQDIPKVVVYVGNDVDDFDAGAAANAGEVHKADDEVWVTYAGTLSACYDLGTLIRAVALLQVDYPHVKLKLLGDGVVRGDLEAAAKQAGCDVEFLGYVPHDVMAAYLAASDILVNSLVGNAPQSIPTKIGDYLAAGKAMLNTSLSPEFSSKVVADGFGVNVQPESVDELRDALQALVADEESRAAMGEAARAVAEEQFDRKRSYQAIVSLIDNLVQR